VLVFPPVPDPYASLSPAELAAFDIGSSCAPAGYGDDYDDEEAGDNDDETEDNE
jgi:hypothetical protein